MAIGRKLPGGIKDPSYESEHREIINGLEDCGKVINGKERAIKTTKKEILYGFMGLAKFLMSYNEFYTGAEQPEMYVYYATEAGKIIASLTGANRISPSLRIALRMRIRFFNFHNYLLRHKLPFVDGKKVLEYLNTLFFYSKEKHPLEYYRELSQKAKDNREKLLKEDPAYYVAVEMLKFFVGQYFKYRKKEKDNSTKLDLFTTKLAENESKNNALRPSMTSSL